MSTPTTLRAVPKRYAGTNFRSTLEADWAATLDHLAIDWEYEPEAIRLPSGDLYRPDFYLPQATTWLEVKGPHDERIGKTRELGRTTTHHPTCESAMVGRPLKLVTFNPDDESAVEKIITSAPKGDSQITIDSRRSEMDNGIFRWIDCKTYKPRRQVALTHILLDQLSDVRTVGGHIQYEDGCDYDWSRPWRLVVIGRPSQRSQTVFEDAVGSRDLLIINCSACDQRSFFDQTGAWTCRRCGKGGKVYHGGSWGSAHHPYAHGDGPLPIRPRTPRRPHRTVGPPAMTTQAKDWVWTAPDGAELRVMQLPDRKSLYVVLTDNDGMRCVARTLGDREATALVTWLDNAVGGGAA